MKVAVISPVAWRTPPRHYGPWEMFASNLADGLYSAGIDVTLYATGDSVTKGKLKWACEKPYEEDKNLDAKVCEYLHISEAMEHAGDYDIIHNSFDFMPLAYSRLINVPMVTTIHGFSSAKILPMYKKYNGNTYYVSISNADRNKGLDYIRTIYHGINLENYEFHAGGEYLLFFGRIHPDKGTHEAIKIANKLHMQLIIAGIIQDEKYYNDYVKPFLSDKIRYIGLVGPDKKSNILGHAAALLHPIHFEEPFGYSVIEAMACGTPVIAFNKGSMQEIIENGKNGFLVNSTDEATEMVKHIASIDPYECRQIVSEKFSQKRMVKEYIQVYKQILSGHTKAG